MIKIAATLVSLLLVVTPAFAEEIPIYEGTYHPGVAGMLSFFIPGAGHMYCEEYGTGALYFGGTVALTAGAVYALGESFSDDSGLSDSESLTLFATCAAGVIVIKAADIVHAARTARAKNLEFGLGAGPRGQAAAMFNYRF